MNNLSKADRHALGKIIESLYHFSSPIVIPSLLSSERLSECLQRELENNPELFFVDSFKLMYTPILTSVYPNYTYDKSSFLQTVNACRDTANHLINRIQAKDNYSKALQAHDFLAKNVQYVNGISKDLHSIVGPFTKKQAVCEGYAKAYKYMLDLMNIPCEIVCGFGYNTQIGIEEKHAWNIIQLNRNWMHVDVTFDATIRNGEILRYDYFCLSNEQIVKDHRYEVNKYPKAISSDYGYYEKNDLIMYTKKQLRDYLSRTLNAGKTECVFKLPDSSREDNLNEIVLKEIQSVLLHLKKNIGYVVFSNLKQRVFHIQFEN